MNFIDFNSFKKCFLYAGFLICVASCFAQNYSTQPHFSPVTALAYREASDTVFSCGEDGMVTSLTVKSVITGAENSIDVSGVFVAVGMTPNSELFSQITECNKEGFIITGPDCSTQMPGLYAAGDVRTKDLRQIVTAVADGAVAVSSLVKYLSE